MQHFLALIFLIKVKSQIKASWMIQTHGVIEIKKPQQIKTKIYFGIMLPILQEGDGDDDIPKSLPNQNYFANK